MMASIAECLNACQAWKKNGEFQRFYERVERERKAYEQLKCLHMLCGEDVKAFDYDRSRFVITCDRADITGEELFVKLRDEYQIE